MIYSDTLIALEIDDYLSSSSINEKYNKMAIAKDFASPEEFKQYIINLFADWYHTTNDTKILLSRLNK